MSTYDYSTLFTTLTHNVIKEKLLDNIEGTFYKNEGRRYLDCNDKKTFITSADHYVGYNLWSCLNVCNALYRQIADIPMGTNCAPLVTDLFLFCYEREFMKNMSYDNQANFKKAFNSTPR